MISGPLIQVTKPNTKNSTPMMTIEVTYWRPVCGNWLLGMAQLPLMVDSEVIREDPHLLVIVVKSGLPCTLSTKATGYASSQSNKHRLSQSR